MKYQEMKTTDSPQTAPAFYAAVVGGVNIDIGGRSYAPLVARDSNPGRISVNLGGVGRNIAHSLRLLDVPVCFLTAFGEDLYAQRILQSCRELQIDIRQALQVPGGTTSTYVFVNDSDGDMSVALSDMEICEQLTPDYLSSQAALLNQAQLVIVDANIPEASLAWLADHCTAPLYADPVSTRKALKLKPILGKLHTVKPNRLEAELLSDVWITDEASLEKAAQVLLDKGLRQVFISLGKDGVYAAAGEERLHLPCLPAQIRNATGAGDAFTAALAWASLQGYGLEDTCRAALAAAAIVAESPETIPPQLCPAAIRQRLASV